VDTCQDRQTADNLDYWAADSQVLGYYTAE